MYKGLETPLTKKRPKFLTDLASKMDQVKKNKGTLLIGNTPN